MQRSRRLALTSWLLSGRQNGTLAMTGFVNNSLAPTPHPPASTPDSRDAQTPATITLDKSVSDSEASLEVKSRKRGLYYRGRPAFSGRSPHAWQRPLAPSVLPAYDEALNFIKRDSAALKVQANALRAAIAVAERTSGQAVDGVQTLQGMRETLRRLEIASEINLPSVRWRAARGVVDMSDPVLRYLVEQKWRKEGALDLLMERLHQMHVIPDVVPDLHPSLDLQVVFPKPPRLYPHGSHRQNTPVEPGVHLLPEQTLRPPRLYTTVFHTDLRLYTLIMVDPDVPDEVNFTYQTYLHWLQPNIALSANLPNGPLPDLNLHTPYIPPHPQKGTKCHRYTLLMLPQPSPVELISIPAISNEQRLGFNVREFMSRCGLDRTVGGGAHMWREVWSEEVSRIYKRLLKTTEPRYGRMPKVDPYEEVKRTQRYL